MLNLEVISRKDAKAQGLTRFFTGRPCRQGHRVARFVSSGACVECSLKRLAEWRQLNLERLKENNRKWWASNPQKNVTKMRRWQKANPFKVSAQKAKRHARRLQACPKWVANADLQAIYLQCRKLTKETGIEYHVDHIIPLVNPSVCGLHVPWNLRIVSAEENLRKSNRFLDV